MYKLQPLLQAEKYNIYVCSIWNFVTANYNFACFFTFKTEDDFFSRFLDPAGAFTNKFGSLFKSWKIRIRLKGKSCRWPAGQRVLASLPIFQHIKFYRTKRQGSI